MKTFMRRVIVIPDKLQSMLLASLIFLAVQGEVALGNYFGVDFNGILKPIAAAVALAVGFIGKVVLEHYIPEAWHPVVNTILVVIAGFFGAHALLP